MQVELVELNFWH